MFHSLLYVTVMSRYERSYPEDRYSGGGGRDYGAVERYYGGERYYPGSSRGGDR